MPRPKILLTRLLASLALCAIAAAQTQPAAPTYPTASPKILKAVAADSNAFAIDLYSRLASHPGNLLFSPYSISSALTMAYAGARGQTATQMAHTLHFSLPDDQLHAAIGALSGELMKEASADGKTLYQL